jgi:hypothetical protein
LSSGFSLQITPLEKKFRRTPPICNLVTCMQMEIELYKMNMIHPLNSKVLTFDDDKGGEINLKSGID